MAAGSFVGIDGFRWLSALVAVLTIFVLGDAFVGHYRTAFRIRAQYVPFVVGAALSLGAASAAIAPAERNVAVVLSVVGWTAVATGVLGAALHHWYGIVRQAGGYSWLLHNLMYKAPPFAPLALTALGATAVIVARGLTAVHHGGADGVGELGRSALIVAMAALALSLAQSAILHFRGAFHDPLMWAPFGAPVAAVVIGVLYLAWPAARLDSALIAALWLSVMTGFVGLGMHFRGLDRHMGGLYAGWATLLEGPPPLAPAMISGFSAIALIARRLLAGA